MIRPKCGERKNTIEKKKVKVRSCTKKREYLRIERCRNKNNYRALIVSALTLLVGWQIAHPACKAVVTTTIWLLFDCSSTALRPFDELRYDLCVWAGDRFSEPSDPQTVPISDFLYVFKSRLKTFLFTQAFTEHWSDLPPAPLKLRAYGAIEIPLLLFFTLGRYVPEGF